MSSYNVVRIRERFRFRRAQRPRTTYARLVEISYCLQQLEICYLQEKERTITEHL